GCTESTRTWVANASSPPQPHVPCSTAPEKSCWGCPTCAGHMCIRRGDVTWKFGDCPARSLPRMYAPTPAQYTQIYVCINNYACVPVLWEIPAVFPAPISGTNIDKT
uniref:Uncharacterized protein n=1 Tax=Apteryx owenii TaxID=8824 RepID=A0A8B9P0S6_APTOW